MPGVIITTSASSGLSNAEADASGQVFVVGLAARGPIDKATLVRGFADFEAKFGTRVAYSNLWDIAKTFFDEGGSQMYVARVVGKAAKAGTVTLNATEGSTPLYEASATSPGSWSENVSIVVAAGTLPNTINVRVLVAGKAVETWSNVASRADFASRINTNSTYITVKDLGATGTTLPAVGSYALVAGTDDRDSITTADHVEALERFPEGLGDGAVISADSVAINSALVDHAKANNRVALLYSGNPDASITDLGVLPDTDAAGLFFPWVQVSDNAGNVRSVPPVGYVAAVRNRAHQQIGAWRAPAGEIAVARTLVGVSKEFSRAEADALDAARVSVIRRIANGVRLYGWRSLSSDQQNFGFLNARDLLNRVVVKSSKQLEQFVFAPVDSKGQLLSSINSELVGILEPIRLAGGLYPLTNAEGKETDNGYLVDTSSAVNTLESIAKNEVHARVAIRVSPIGALVTLDIVKVGLLSGLS